jgi:hypothetical protein
MQLEDDLYVFTFEDKSWVRKRLACPDADVPPPSQSLPPAGGGPVGA